MSKYADIKRMVENKIWLHNLAEYVKTNVTELPDGSVKIEAWFTDDEGYEEVADFPAWLPIAEFLFEYFGGDPGRFEHVSTDGSENGHYVEYVVR